MRVFVDTSALLAVLNADDKFHQEAKTAWVELVSSDTALFSSNYVLVELFALVQHRLGMEAVRVLSDDLLPLVTVEWVDEVTHGAGVCALETASRRKLSLVDCVSFETMRRLGLKKVFTFDPHFSEQGFQCVPPQHSKE